MTGWRAVIHPLVVALCFGGAMAMATSSAFWGHRVFILLPDGIGLLSQGLYLIWRGSCAKVDAERAARRVLGIR